MESKLLTDLNIVSTTGRLIYDPPRPGLKKVRPGSFLVVEVDNEIARYYRWWVKKRFGLELQATAWRPHITVVDGKNKLTDLQIEHWKKYQHETISFVYSVDVQQHWKFWCLPVESHRLREIRKEMGLAENFPLHITFGRMF